MALPRVFDLTLVRKSPKANGQVVLTFRVNAANASVRGRCRVIATAAVAADFTVGSEYDASVSAEA